MALAHPPRDPGTALRPGAHSPSPSLCCIPKASVAPALPPRLSLDGWALGSDPEDAQGWQGWEGTAHSSSGLAVEIQPH